jgi:hypothetical protein
MVRFESTSTFTVDVSTGGFCLGLMKVLPVGEEIDGWIIVDGSPFTFSGRVAWSAPGYRHMNLSGKIGVRFTRNSSELARLLEFPSRPMSLVGT